MIRQWPACTAMPARPARGGARIGRRADRRQIGAPLLPGLLDLDQHAAGPSRRRPAQRASSASVPSTASTPSTRPCCTTTAWPMSSSPRRAATSMPSAMSRIAVGVGRQPGHRALGREQRPRSACRRRPPGSLQPRAPDDRLEQPVVAMAARRPSLARSCMPRQIEASGRATVGAPRRSAPPPRPAGRAQRIERPADRAERHPAMRHALDQPRGRSRPRRRARRPRGPARAAADHLRAATARVPARTASLRAMAHADAGSERGRQIERLPALRMKR